MIKIFDAIIIGGGAAGLFCAYQLAGQAQEVLLLDHNHKLARKIKVSGGGRCNFSNLDIQPNHYICPSPHFVKPALKNFTNQDFIQLIDEHQIAYEEKELGQLFTINGSHEIIELLLKLCHQNKVIIEHPIKLETIDYKDELYHLTYHDKELDKSFNAQAKNLIIATGGLSFKGLGASGLGYKIAEQFGHHITPLSPALVGLKCHENFQPLSGISILGKVCFKNQEFTHQILFTHFGLSGPAILQISNYWQNDMPIYIDFLVQTSFAKLVDEARKNKPKSTAYSLLKPYLPRRFIDYILADYTFASKNISELSRKQINLLQIQLHEYAITPISTIGYNKAEVTRGGIDVTEIQSKSMESKKQKGLFFIGEVLDVTGHLGGYNLQWAWSSASLAAQYISLK
ncbi:MAG: NAD(P)/FAD-dependent oxidoreductase [Alphaproteobacteria bacterium]